MNRHYVRLDCPLRKKRLAGIAIGFSLTFALLQPAWLAAGSKCFPREGRCVLVQVNDQLAGKLSRQGKKLLKGLEHLSHYVDDTLFELEQPVNGELEIRVDGGQGSESWFQGLSSTDVKVIPLDEVDLDTTSGLVERDTVRVEGDAAMAQADFLKSNKLPAGRYLLVVTLKGQANWDRAVVLMNVTD